MHTYTHACAVFYMYNVLQGSKRKSSGDSESALATPPPRKQPRLDLDLSSSSSKESTSSSNEVTTGLTSKPMEPKETEVNKERTEEEHLDSEELSEGSCDAGEPMITLCTPESQLTPPDDNVPSNKRELSVGAEEEDRSVTLDSEVPEKVDVDDNPLSESTMPESTPEPSVPPPPPQPQPQPQPQPDPRSSIVHDHTYCSQRIESDVPEADAVPSSSKVEKSSVSGDDVGRGQESLVTEANRSKLSLMVHDHTYCYNQTENNAQSATAPSNPRGEEMSSGGKESQASRSKLTLTVHDHTYCSSSWQQRCEPCLIETLPENPQPLEDGDAVTGEGGDVTREGGDAVTGEGGDVTGEGGDVTREGGDAVMGDGDDATTREDVGDTGEPVLMEESEPLVTKDDSEMETTEVVNASTQVDLDGSVNSDVLTETESSQSQELFSQHTSQLCNTLSSAGPSYALTSPLDTREEEAQDQKTVERPQDTTADDGESCKDKESVSTGEVEKLEGHGENEASGEVQEGECGQEASKEEEGNTSETVQPLAGGKVQPQLHSIPTGDNSSSNSSDSTNPTHIAECSQRATSVAAISPLPLTDSTHTTPTHDQTNSESSKFLNALAQLKDLSKAVSEMLKQRLSMSHSELLACHETGEEVSLFIQALMQHHTRAAMASQDPLS